MLLLPLLCCITMDSTLYERQLQRKRQRSDRHSDGTAVCSIHSITVPAAAVIAQ
jgi:hypothetical protein